MQQESLPPGAVESALNTICPKACMKSRAIVRTCLLWPPGRPLMALYSGADLQAM